MMRALFTAGTGMQAQQTNVDVIANNLANVNTMGFKRSRAEFQDLLYQTIRAPGTTTATGNQVPTGAQVGMGARTSSITKLFLQGDFQNTMNELDVAIEGKGFFQVTKPDGSIGYTRAGAWRLDSTGQVVNPDGYPIEPPIVIPNDSTLITVSPQGEVAVKQPGSITPSVVGQIELANFVNPAGLLSAGKNLFDETDASGAPVIGNPGTNEMGTVLQGFVEMSNVNVVEELTNMITAQRAYELNSKAIQTADDMLQTANQTKR